MKHLHLANSLKSRHTLAILLLAFVLVAGQWIIHGQIKVSTSDTELLNRTARQRMLAQRIIKNFAVIMADLETSGDVAVTEEKLEIIRNDLSKIKMTDEWLAYRANTKGLIPDTKRSISAFEQLNREIDNFCLRSANLENKLAGLLQIEKNSIVVQQEIRPEFINILDLDTSVIQGVDVFVAAIEDELAERFVLVEYFELGLFVLFLVILALETWFVLRPALDQINKDMQELKRTSQAKSEFVAFISHEMRTPLHCIIGVLELLKGTQLIGEQRKFIRTLERASGSLLGLINNVLDLSKIEAGKLEFEKVGFNLSSLIEEIVDVLSVRARDKNIELRFEVVNIPKLVVGDYHRIRQVLVNIVGNAIKFTEHGEVLLKVISEAQDSQSLTVKFVVADTGIGIPKEKMGLIFTEFGQVDVGVARQYGGSGLGLSISKHLIEKMGGKIWFESEKGKGTSFYIDVPFGKVVSSSTVPVLDSEESSNVSADVSPVSAIKVLVVDDSEDNRMLMRAFFQARGIAIVEATTGVEGYEKFILDVFDVVFMDMKMPDMSGLDCIRKMRSWEKAEKVKPVCIITVSASSLPEEIAESYEVGSTYYLSKPFRTAKLRSVLEELGIFKS